MFTTGWQTTQCWVVIISYRPVVSLSLLYHLHCAKQRVEFCRKVIVSPYYGHRIFKNINRHNCDFSKPIYLTVPWIVLCRRHQVHVRFVLQISVFSNRSISQIQGAVEKLNSSHGGSKNLLPSVYRHSHAIVIGHPSPYTLHGHRLTQFAVHSVWQIGLTLE